MHNPLENNGEQMGIIFLYLIISKKCYSGELRRIDSPIDRKRAYFYALELKTEY